MDSHGAAEADGLRNPISQALIEVARTEIVKFDRQSAFKECQMARLRFCMGEQGSGDAMSPPLGKHGQRVHEVLVGVRFGREGKGEGPHSKAREWGRTERSQQSVSRRDTQAGQGFAWVAKQQANDSSACYGDIGELMAESVPAVDEEVGDNLPDLARREEVV